MQRDIRLSSAFVPPCDSGLMWCTSSAGVSLPFRLHTSHKGCAEMYLSRMTCHARPYLFFTSGERSYLSYLFASALACSSQNRPWVSLGQPGNEHGRFGLYGIAFNSLSCIRKALAEFSTKALCILFVHYNNTIRCRYHSMSLGILFKKLLTKVKSLVMELI